MSQQIELHIEELILHGFPPDRRYAIAQAIEMKLTRLLTEQKIPAALKQDGIVRSINAGSIHINNESKSEATGNKIANAVYKCFTK
jgi:hypothetical protein